MKLQERLVQFQNQAERDFQGQKNLSTLGRYGLALLIFITSTLLAAFTLPLRVPIKMISGKSTPAGVVKLDSASIDAILKQHPLVLIDFWAEWCGPCVMMNPTIEAFAAGSPEVTVAKVNADMNRDVVNRYKVKGIPHLILIKDGQEVKRHAGPMTQAELKRFCSVAE